MSRRNLFIGVLLFFTVVFAVAETAGITVSVDKPRPNMGDRVTIEARAMVQEGEDVTFHHQEPGSPDLVFGEPETVRESLPDGYVLFRFSRSVQPFALGTQSLGTLDVVVNGEQETRDIPELDVVPIFPEGREKDSINPLKPQMDLDPDYSHLWRYAGWFLGGAALLLALLWAIRWLVRRWRDRKAGIVPEVPEQPPFEELRNRIGELLAGSYLKEGRVKAFYVDLSEIGKHFLGRVFSIQAEVETTSELLDCLSNSLRPGETPLVQEFLESCDLVKFARYQPDQGEINHHVNLAYQFGERIRDRMDSGLATKEADHVPV